MTIRKRYAYAQPDGTVKTGVRRVTVLAAAARRLTVGSGPFTITRDGWYKHPSLYRRAALRMLGSMAPTLDVGSQVQVHNKASASVFTFRRVANEALYKNPMRDCAGLKGLRQDQGVDYSVSVTSPVYAIGPGVVTVVRPTSSGWPWDVNHAERGAYVAYEITEGPAKGLFVYDAEHIVINPALHVGSHVDAGTIIAHHLPDFANCEMGWAGATSQYGVGPGDAPEAVNQYNEGERTRAGDNFDLFMRALGVVAGLTEGRSITGTLPSKYPTSWNGKV